MLSWPDPKSPQIRPQIRPQIPTNKVTKPYYIFLVIFLLIIPANISAVNSENRLILYAIIDFDEIVESSGIIKSKKYPGVFWTHNDSGDSARIFAITEDGKIIKPNLFKGEYKGIEVVNAANIDWEDIATDGAGNLIIGDFGNNWRNRQDLQLYVIKEPNPYKTLKTEAIKKINFKYPDQARKPHYKTNFDTEALFVKNGKYFILTKNRGDKKTEMYVLDEFATKRVNELKHVGGFDFGGFVTGADLSENEKRLVVLTNNSVWLFENKMDTDDFVGGKIYRFRIKPKKQFEGISFNNDEVIISNESNELYRLTLKQIKAVESDQAGLIPPSVERHDLVE